VAKECCAKGFVPDVISSDVHALNIDGPVFESHGPRCRSSIVSASIPDLVRTATSAPAAALRRPDLGSLKLGSTGDATVFAIEEGESISPMRWAKCCADNIGWPAVGSCRAALGGRADRAPFMRGKEMSEPNLVGGSKTDPNRF